MKTCFSILGNSLRFKTFRTKIDIFKNFKLKVKYVQVFQNLTYFRKIKSLTILT